MKKIITRIRPYASKQTLLVYEDGNKIDIKFTTLEELSPSLFELMDKHKTYRLDLVGPKVYLSGIKNQIEENQIQSKFNLQKLEINII